MRNNDVERIYQLIEDHASEEEREALTQSLKNIEKEQKKLAFLQNREKQEKAVMGSLLAKTSEDLMQALQDAQEANRAKSAFLANISHELRTPLGGIIGYTEMVLSGIYGDLTEKQVDRLGRVLSNGKHLLDLINDLLDLSKIEAGKMDLAIETFDLTAVIQEAVNNAKVLAKRKHNQILVEIDHNIGDIYSDHHRVRQILDNLLSNACKFTENGTVSLRVVPIFDGDQDFVEFSVMDDGIGMNEDQVQYIFDRFVQVDDSTTRRYEGTGLGLAITYHLCNMLGGSINVGSRLGEGTVFTVTLPTKYVEPAIEESLF